MGVFGISDDKKREKRANCMFNVLEKHNNKGNVSTMNDNQFSEFIKDIFKALLYSGSSKYNKISNNVESCYKEDCKKTLDSIKILEKTIEYKTSVDELEEAHTTLLTIIRKAHVDRIKSKINNKIVKPEINEEYTRIIKGIAIVDYYLPEFILHFWSSNEDDKIKQEACKHVYFIF